METLAQTHDFQMHHDLLRSVIKKQAGSLDKAILEGVMNSVDAGATSVDITINPLRVTITDNGKGFKDAQEIKDFFATFGTPHKEGDATYGRFRMGRGQMFAFGINTWRTGTFKMLVDINKHLGFELEDNLELLPGCDIEIKLYDVLSQQDVHATIRAITNMVKYVAIPVLINGERVSVEIDEKKFPQSTDEAYIYLSSASNGLAIYNLGVYVCTLPTYRFGASGTVVSKQQLDVNFARNEVLGTCKVWKEIKKIVDATGKREVTLRQTLSISEQQNTIFRLITGDIDESQADKIRFIRDVSGKSWTPAEIRNGRFEFYSVAKRGNQFGDMLIQSKKAIVIDEDFAELFECDGSEIFEKYPFKGGMPKFAEISDLTSGIQSTGMILERKQWKPTEKAWNAVVCRMQNKLQERSWDNEIREYVGQYKNRRIDIGTSRTALGWTDGETFIAISREFLKNQRMFIQGVPNLIAFTEVAMLLIHEACHDTDSRENIHSHEFYQAYHDMTQRLLGRLLADAMRYMTPARYARVCKGNVDFESDDEE